MTLYDFVDPEKRKADARPGWFDRMTKALIDAGDWTVFPLVRTGRCPILRYRHLGQTVKAAKKRVLLAGIFSLADSLITLFPIAIAKGLPVP